MANKISDLGAAAALAGTEPVWVEQSGLPVQTTTQDIADLGGGGGPGLTSRVLTDINTATPPTTEAVTGFFEVRDNEDVDPLAQYGFTNGNNDMFIRNLMHGGEVFITAENASGTIRTILSGNPDASTILTAAGNLQLSVNNTEACLLAIANGQTEIMFNNIGTARTVVAASGGMQVNNTSTGAGYERVLTTADLGGGVTAVTGGEGIDSSGGDTPDITLDLSELNVTSMGSGDWIAFDDAGTSRKALCSAIGLSIFNDNMGSNPGHTHTGSSISSLAAGDTTSGTFADGRIPSLATSKITSGTFVNGRISSGSVTQHLGDYANWTTSGQNDGQMTISTSAASGGANGDIHFRYT